MKNEHNEVGDLIPNCNEKILNSRISKRKRLIQKIVLSVFVFIGVSFLGLVVFFINAWVEKEKTTDINRYEEYLGSQGTHSGSILIKSDIFPNTIPESADVEEFLYYYYNPWDPCFLTYLVYTCDDEDYRTEMKRLKSINSSPDYKVYSLTGFPDKLCAVNADNYGIIYAMTQESENRIIYVEITACNNFTDIDYEKLISNKYLPYGFDMTHK